MRTITSLFVIITLSLDCTFAQAGTIIVNDTFEGGATVGDDGFDALDIPWTGLVSSALTIENSAEFGPSNGIKNGGATTYRGMSGAIPSVQSFSETGESIVLSLDFRSNNGGVLPNDADGYRVGLFDASDQGYYFDIGVQTLNSLTLEKDSGSDSVLAGSTGNTVLATLGGGAPVIDSNDALHLELTLTKTDLGVQLDVDVDNGAYLLSFEDTTSPLTSFDRIFAGTGNHTIDFHMDNVQLEFNLAPPVPEPSSCLLLGLGALSLIRHTRRRRWRA